MSPLKQIKSCTRAFPTPSLKIPTIAYPLNPLFLPQYSRASPSIHNCKWPRRIYLVWNAAKTFLKFEAPLSVDIAQAAHSLPLFSPALHQHFFCHKWNKWICHRPTENPFALHSRYRHDPNPGHHLHPVKSHYYFRQIVSNLFSMYEVQLNNIHHNGSNYNPDCQIVVLVCWLFL